METMVVQLSHSYSNFMKKPKRLRRASANSLGYDSDGANYVIVRLPSSRVMTTLFLSMILACVIVSNHRFNSLIDRSLNSYYPDTSDDPINVDIVSVLFNDLANEGLLKTGQRALFVTHVDDDLENLSSSMHNSFEMDRIHETDLERQSSIRKGSFDFVFTYGYEAASIFINRALKHDGVLAVQLSHDSSKTFEVPANYRIVYFRKFDSPILAMRRHGNQQTNNDVSAGQRRLMGIMPEQDKKAALRNLEDVLLEPPRSASRRSSRYLKKTRYLPDLMGDRLALEKYPRRVFIDVGIHNKDAEGMSGTEWFAKHYPTRNLDFKMYTIETVGEEDREAEMSQGQTETQDQGGMSGWLRGNVKEEEYVVMKADAEVVEEVMMSRAIGLIDELFLECKPKGPSRRAYWECLALYGRLRDEGVAVHQWWG